MAAIIPAIQQAPPQPATTEQRIIPTIPGIPAPAILTIHPRWIITISRKSSLPAAGNRFKQSLFLLATLETANRCNKQSELKARKEQRQREVWKAWPWISMWTQLHRIRRQILPLFSKAEFLGIKQSFYAFCLLFWFACWNGIDIGFIWGFPP